ncbi:class I SAM-dependent methyltransferase, partial [uncultured Oscillibacter sp.]|uniref:class I SAM-dependent methyltransferase n=1 Tax=uncultured Oscillibacter sp. TaxID=876091 RepID=UPI00345679C6
MGSVICSCLPPLGRNHSMAELREAHLRYLLAICERIRPGLTREMNVLELACGSGQLSFRLAGRVRLWEATDFSENMIVEARKKPRSSRLHFSVQDASALPYAPDSLFRLKAKEKVPKPFDFRTFSGGDNRTRICDLSRVRRA